MSIMSRELVVCLVVKEPLLDVRFNIVTMIVMLTWCNGFNIGCQICETRVGIPLHARWLDNYEHTIEEI